MDQKWPVRKALCSTELIDLLPQVGIEPTIFSFTPYAQACATLRRLTRYPLRYWGILYHHDDSLDRLDRVKQ